MFCGVSSYCWIGATWTIDLSRLLICPFTDWLRPAGLGLARRHYLFSRTVNHQKVPLSFLHPIEPIISLQPTPNLSVAFQGSLLSSSSIPISIIEVVLVSACHSYSWTLLSYLTLVLLSKRVNVLAGVFASWNLSKSETLLSLLTFYNITYRVYYIEFIISSLLYRVYPIWFILSHYSSLSNAYTFIIYCSDCPNIFQIKVNYVITSSTKIINLFILITIVIYYLQP